MNAVIYAKYYGENNIKGISLEEQIKMCNQYAKDNNLKVIKIYQDYAWEEYKKKNQEFQQMIKDSKKKKFQAVIVYQLDILARNRYDRAIYKNKLKKNSVRVFSAKITDDASGIFMESMLEGMAEYYSVELEEKSKKEKNNSVNRRIIKIRNEG